MSVLPFVLSREWAITQPALKTITEIAGRTEVDAATIADWKNGKFEAVEARDGVLSRSGTFAIRDGVGIIDVIGPIFRYSNLLTLSGASSLSSLSKSFNDAMSDPNVDSVLFNIDSPGGQADGISEFADMIHAMRGVKPIQAFIDGTGASAAYWIAAATDRITISKTAIAGSIGVVAAFEDTTERDKTEGVKTLKFISAVSPNKQLDPRTEAGAEDIQARVDALADVFIDSIATFRNVSVATVLSDFGQGGVQMGEDAVASGLVDRVGSFEGTLKAIASGVPISGDVSVQMEDSKMAEQNNAQGVETPTPVTLESVKTDNPVIAAALVAEGAVAERDRINAIQANSLPGHDDLVATMIADGTSVADAAIKMVAAEKAKGVVAMESITKAIKKVPAIEADADVADTSTVNSSLPIEDRCKAKWDKDADLRSQFTSFDQFVFSEKAAENGQSKVLAK